ncbi:hypothetical protein [Paenibacillus elgii]|uniref:hypothetical protein n=1 Tax=Paenibacillus elgii TaxID=189691 RepID=UPI000248D22D|nr:hypothetical protein [Paenibacillus elgii]
MEQLKTQKFDSKECLEDVISRLEDLLKVCDGRKMDERLGNDFTIMIHDLSLVKKDIFK